MGPDRLQQFFERISSEREELREDLLGLTLDIPKCKVGDFGCGWGYITWCLMLEIPNSDCIGIDKFDPDNPPPEPEDMSRNEQFTIDNVQNRFKKVVDEIHSGTVELQKHDLSRNLCSQLSRMEKYPVIQKGNLLTGEILPSNPNPYFDLIYCKRVLYNIFLGDNKNPDRDDGINLAINHIANALKPNGWFCLVEIAELRNLSVLEDSLGRSGFTFGLPRPVNRRYNTIFGNNDRHPYLIYHCRKAE